MKLQKYRSCWKCRALDPRGTGTIDNNDERHYYPGCALDFKTGVKDEDTATIHKDPRMMRPVEPCWKPVLVLDLKWCEANNNRRKAQKHKAQFTGGLQKFLQGTIVHIGNTGQFMKYFTQNCFAIVDGTYAQLCAPHHNGGLDNYKQYSLYLLTDDPHSCSWYYEHQLRAATNEEIKRLKKEKKL